MCTIGYMVVRYSMRLFSLIIETLTDFVTAEVLGERPQTHSNTLPVLGVNFFSWSPRGVFRSVAAPPLMASMSSSRESAGGPTEPRFSFSMEKVAHSTENKPVSSTQTIHEVHFSYKLDASKS